MNKKGVKYDFATSITKKNINNNISVSDPVPALVDPI